MNRRFQPGFDDTPNLPKYLRLANWLEQQIVSGVFAPDSMLPTEEQLCRDFDLSRGTVQQAIGGLVQKGLVRREQGRGTFVNPARQADVSSFTLINFDQMMRQQGRIPTTQLVSAAIIPTNAEVAATLGIAPEIPAIHIVRLRLADGQPVSLEERFLAHDLCPDLIEQDLEHESIHRLLVEKYQLPMVRMEQSVEIVAAEAPIANTLRVATGSKLFFVERLTYTLQGKARIPAVWFRAYYHDTTLQIGADLR